jgi:hypothetical protein
VSIGGLVHEVCGFGPTAEVVELNSLEALKRAEKLPADSELKSLLFPGKLFHLAADRPCLRKNNMPRVSYRLLRFSAVTHNNLRWLTPGIRRG